MGVSVSRFTVIDTSEEELRNEVLDECAVCGGKQFRLEITIDKSGDADLGEKGVEHIGEHIHDRTDYITVYGAVCTTCACGIVVEPARRLSYEELEAEVE